MSFEPQTAVKLTMIEASRLFETTPLNADVTLMVCPDNVNMQIEVLSVGVVCHTLPADGSAVTIDLEFIDDSDSDAVNEMGLAAGSSAIAFDMTGATVRVYNEIWNGSQILDPGDAINAELTDDGTLDTAAQGVSFIVAYRILKRSAA